MDGQTIIYDDGHKFSVFRGRTFLLDLSIDHIRARAFVRQKRKEILARLRHDFPDATVTEGRPPP